MCAGIGNIPFVVPHCLLQVGRVLKVVTKARLSNTAV